MVGTLRVKDTQVSEMSTGIARARLVSSLEAIYDFKMGMIYKNSG